MLRLRSRAFDLAMYALMLLMGIACAPMALWSVDGAYAAMKAYCRATFWLLRMICGLTIEIRGEPPQGDVLVCAKHMSFLDVMILMERLPRAKFIMKKELRWVPVLGFYALRIGSTPVDRSRRSRAMQEMIARASRSLEPAQLVIYPQGTRVPPGAQLPYKIGAAALYDRLGRPCVPAASNVGVFWGPRSPDRRPGRAVMEFLDPIPPGLPVARFMALIETTIEDHSNRLMREAGYDGPLPPPQRRRRAASGDQ